MRHEELSVNKLIATTIVNGAGSSLLTSNTLATNSMYVGVGGVATAKTLAQVNNYLDTASGFTRVYSGVSSTTDSTGTVTITVAGAAASDYAQVTLNGSTAAVYVVKAVCGSGNVVVTLSGAGGVGTKIFYSVFRAVT